MKKLWFAGISLSVIAAVAVAVPAMTSLAHEPAVEEQARACEALAGDLTGGVTDLQSGLVALPPKLDTVPSVVNGLLGQVTSLIDLGCLPTPELPVAAPLKGKDQLIPPLPPVGGTLPTVPVCTDLTADLLDAVTGVLAALLSTGGLPDLTGALDAITDLLDTLTGLTDTTNSCLPAAPLAKR